MDLQTRKLSFVQEFLRLQNEEIINSLEKMLRAKKTESYERILKPMDLETFNKEIDQAMIDSKESKLTEASELKAKIQKWT